MKYLKNFGNSLGKLWRHFKKIFVKLERNMEGIVKKTNLINFTDIFF